MEQIFWENMWEKLDAPFRQSPCPVLLALLQQYTDVKNILVPLCGVNYDLIWLAQQGFNVTGIDFSTHTIDKFATFYNTPLQQIQPHQYHYQSAGQFTLHVSDFMIFNTTKSYQLIYDMGGLVALPAVMRKAYVAHLLKFLSPTTRCAILTKNDIANDSGPPFHITQHEINSLFNIPINKVTPFLVEDMPQVTTYIITSSS